MGELIAVLSGKGGTGKTSICAAVASSLALSGERVLCIDCDVGLRNLDIALGISDLGSLSFLDICREGCGLTRATVHPQIPTLSFLTAPMNCPVESVDSGQFLSLLQAAREGFSYVFMDAPAGIDMGFKLAAQYADRILLVAGADPASIRDARRAAEVLEGMDKKNVRLIVNRLHKKTAAAMNLTVDDIMDQAGLPLIGVVPEDSNVLLSAVCHQPLVKYSRRGASAACGRIAKRIQGRTVPVRL